MAALVITFGLVSAIIWLVIGWRAMRAHENIATHLARYLDSTRPDEPPRFRPEGAAQHKLYKQFLHEHPEAERQPSKERHSQFREWLRDHDGGESES